MPIPDHDRMRVVHLISSLDRGGAELAMARLVTDAGSRARMKSTVISLRAVGPVAHMLKSAGIHVHALGIHSFFSLPIGAWRLWRLLGQLKPELVQTWMYHSDLLGGVVATMRGIPVVWGIRTTSLGAGNAHVTRFVRWACARLSPVLPAAAICVAQTARRAHEAEGYKIRSMHVIPNGVDVHSREWSNSTRRAWRERYGLQDGELVMGWVGRFNPDKDVQTFVIAASAVLHRYERARVVMVGRGLQSDNTELVDWIRDGGAEDRFVLLGEQLEVAACYCGFDLFVLSSTTEAFPNVLAEAMAAGLPCVSTDVGDARELLGSTGRLVAARAAGPMAEEMSRLLLEAETRSDLGRQARQRIENHFSMQTCATRYAKVYADVCDAKG